MRKNENFSSFFEFILAVFTIFIKIYLRRRHVKEFCIVIPVYKTELDCIEQISLKRLNEVIGGKGYDVYLVCPHNLEITNFTNIYKDLKTKTYSPDYFRNTATYSQLCVSYDFYNDFSDYKYMIIYQLDCYLFYDKLTEWCKGDFDYVGGPILSTDCGWNTVKKNQNGVYHPYVGNGGFSLRKIETFKEITDPNGEFRKRYEITDEILKNVRFEDKFFCNDIYDYFKLYTPSWSEALYFALDMSVDIVFINMKWPGTPMCAHAVDKNIRYWKKVIPEFIDNKEVIDFCEKKHEDFFKLYYDENDSTFRVAPK